MFYLNSNGRSAVVIYAPSGASGVKVVSHIRDMICSTGGCILKLFKALFHGKLNN